MTRKLQVRRGIVWERACESLPRTEKSWRLLILLNLEELINPGEQELLNLSKATSTHWLHPHCITQTTPKKLVATICKKYRIIYTHLKQQGKLKEFLNIIQKPLVHQYCGTNYVLLKISLILLKISLIKKPHNTVICISADLIICQEKGNLQNGYSKISEINVLSGNT